MIKRLAILGIIVGIVTASNSQVIAKWKIEDVVRSFSANNDTVYVVSFWATFCKPCNAEIPDFIRLTDKYKKQKVKLLLVSLDLPSYVPVKLPEFIKKNKYKTNHAWLNETDADRFCPMIDAKWSGAIPATIIVNNKTGYRKFVEDQISPEDFEAALKAALEGTAMNKYVAPMNDAVGIENPNTNSETPGMPDFIRFKSNDSSVYSITDGKVRTVARIEDMKIVIIENEHVFYTYSNMGSTKLKTGELVKANQFIGYATKNLDGEVALELYKNDSKGNYITLTKDNFITRKDKKLADHSIDSNEPQ
ncbi:MAG: redoxin domain-containing protein [Ferruginibacter sp.]